MAEHRGAQIQAPKSTPSTKISMELAKKASKWKQWHIFCFNAHFRSRFIQTFSGEA